MLPERSSVATEQARSRPLRHTRIWQGWEQNSRDKLTLLVTQRYATTDGSGRTVDIALTANASLPGMLTPGGNNNLATTISYTTSFAVTSVSGPNGAGTTTSYDNYGRPSVSTMVDGAATSYSYTYNPNTQRATWGTGGDLDYAHTEGAGHR